MTTERESSSKIAADSDAVRATLTAAEQIYFDRLDAAVVGHATAKRDLARILQSFSLRDGKTPIHTLLTGDAGCGKGTIGRALCLALAPLPHVFIEHADEIREATAQPPPQNTFVFIRNVDNLVLNGEKLEPWLDAAAKRGTLVVASVASSQFSVGLQLVFGETIELAPLTRRELEAAMLHASSVLSRAIGEGAKRGVTVVMLPEAKRALADAASSSGRGMVVVRDFARGLTAMIASLGRGDFIVDRSIVDAIVAS